MAIKISSPNLSKVSGQLKALVTKIPIAAKQSSKIIATEILQASLTENPTCPMDTGALRSTGRVEAVQEGYAVVYGGMAANGVFVDYAGYVHDDLRPRKYTVPGSGPKFVETHFDRMSATAGDKISKQLQELADSIITEGR